MCHITCQYLQPKWEWTDQQFVDEAFAYIKRINPKIGDEDLVDAKVGRLRHAQPILRAELFATNLPVSPDPRSAASRSPIHVIIIPRIGALRKAFDWDGRMAEDVRKKTVRRQFAASSKKRMELIIYEAGPCNGFSKDGDLDANSATIACRDFGKLHERPLEYL